MPHRSSLPEPLRVSSDPTREEVARLWTRLETQHSLRYMRFSSGLFPASPCGPQSEYTGYQAAWVGDNVHVAHAHHALGHHRTALAVMRALCRYFRQQRGRFEAIVAGVADLYEPMNRPHIRCAGETLDELPGRWAHAQNDALGYFAWLFALLVAAGTWTPKDDEWAVLAWFPPYFQAIQYWQNADNGHWEEAIHHHHARSRVAVTQGALRRKETDMRTHRCAWFVAALAVVVLTAPDFSMAQQPTAAERVAALKGSLAASQASLRQYQWIETTAVSLKGEEKSRKQEQCFYGADGKLTKVLLTQPPPEEKKHGLRGKIAESKKEEMTDYMHEAVNLVRQFVPPDPARIQAVKDAGKVSIQVTDPGKRVRLTFSAYLKIGDSLAVDMDLTNNIPLAANVNSYLDSQKEPVMLSLKFGLLNDGTIYVSGAVLDAPGKSLKVTIENSGYRKMGQ